MKGLRHARDPSGGPSSRDPPLGKRRSPLWICRLPLRTRPARGPVPRVGDTTVWAVWTAGASGAADHHPDHRAHHDHARDRDEQVGGPEARGGRCDAEGHQGDAEPHHAHVVLHRPRPPTGVGDGPGVTPVFPSPAAPWPSPGSPARSRRACSYSPAPISPRAKRASRICRADSSGVPDRPRRRRGGG